MNLKIQEILQKQAEKNSKSTEIKIIPISKPSIINMSNPAIHIDAITYFYTFDGRSLFFDKKQIRPILAVPDEVRDAFLFNNEDNVLYTILLSSKNKLEYCRHDEMPFGERSIISRNVLEVVKINERIFYLFKKDDNYFINEVKFDGGKWIGKHILSHLKGNNIKLYGFNGSFMYINDGILYNMHGENLGIECDFCYSSGNLLITGIVKKLDNKHDKKSGNKNDNNLGNNLDNISELPVSENKPELEYILSLYDDSLTLKNTYSIFTNYQCSLKCIENFIVVNNEDKLYILKFDNDSINLLDIRKQRHPIYGFDILLSQGCLLIYILTDFELTNNDQKYVRVFAREDNENDDLNITNDKEAVICNDVLSCNIIEHENDTVYTIETEPNINDVSICDLTSIALTEPIVDLNIELISEASSEPVLEAENMLVENTLIENIPIEKAISDIKLSIASKNTPNKLFTKNNLLDEVRVNLSKKKSTTNDSYETQKAKNVSAKHWSNAQNNLAQNLKNNTLVPTMSKNNTFRQFEKIQNDINSKKNKDDICSKDAFVKEMTGKSPMKIQNSKTQKAENISIDNLLSDLKITKDSSKENIEFYLNKLSDNSSSNFQVLVAQAFEAVLLKNSSFIKDIVIKAILPSVEASFNEMRIQMLSEMRKLEITSKADIFNSKNIAFKNYLNSGKIAAAINECLKAKGVEFDTMLGMIQPGMIEGVDTPTLVLIIVKLCTLMKKSFKDHYCKLLYDALVDLEVSELSITDLQTLCIQLRYCKELSAFESSSYIELATLIEFICKKIRKRINCLNL